MKTSNTMSNIIIKDEATGKELLIRGHGLDYEIFQRSKGKKVDGVLKGEGEWVSARKYPGSLPNAVRTCIRLLLANPNDSEPVLIEIDKTADKAAAKLAKILKARVQQIVVEVEND